MLAGERHGSQLDHFAHRAQVIWDAKAWSAADDRRRRVHADATLAASAAHMAGPLITSKHLQVLLPPTDVHNILLDLGGSSLPVQVWKQPQCLKLANSLPADQ